MLTEFFASTFGFICLSIYPAVCIGLRWHYRAERRSNPFPQMVALLLPLAYIMMFGGAFAGMCALRMEYDKPPRDTTLLWLVACGLNIAGMISHIALDGLRRPDMADLMRRWLAEYCYDPDDRSR
ncbi:MAG: hypothetical protein AAGJ40_09385 [Planctomycetota bacterium]